MRLLNFLSKKVEDAEVAGTIANDAAAKTYIKQLAVHIAVTYIANTISKCEIKTFEGGKEVKGNLYYLLNVSPNPNQSSSQFMNELVERYYYDGEALVVPVKGKALYVARGYSMHEVPLKDNVFSAVDVEGQSIGKDYRARDVFFFKLDNSRVLQLIDGMYGDYGEVVSAAIEKYKRSGRDLYKLVLESTEAGNPEFNRKYNEFIKNNLESFIKANRAVYPQYRGQVLERMQSETADAADVINMRKEVFESVAQAFKIPMSMMLGNITNMNEIVKVYLSICIDPLAQMISEELTRKTASFEEWKRGNRVVVDTSCINHLDIFEVGDKVDKLISSGFACVDELRDRVVGFEPIGEDFAKRHYITKNYQPAEDAMTASEGGESNEQEVLQP